MTKVIKIFDWGGLHIVKYINTSNDMYKDYYVNKDAQITGEHEVHTKDCSYLPSNRIYLGYFSSCKDAMIAAKKHYINVDGCYYCCFECHKR